MLRVAAVDIGLKRIGVALAFDNRVVLPQEAIIRKNRVQASKDLDKFLEEFEIDILIVGIPIGGESEDEMRRRIEYFISLLDYSGDIFYQDEYGTSQEAKEIIVGIRRDRRDGKVDSIAAKIILERWLDNKHGISI